MSLAQQHTWELTTESKAAIRDMSMTAENIFADWCSKSKVVMIKRTILVVSVKGWKMVVVRWLSILLETQTQKISPHICQDNYSLWFGMLAGLKDAKCSSDCFLPTN